MVAAISDVFAAFPATSTRRQVLNAALAQFVDVVGRLALGTLVVIDGSYITRKPDPADIDLALLSTGASEIATLQRLQQEGVDLALLDVFVSTTQADFDNWVSFFSADRTGQPRGVVLLAI